MADGGAGLVHDDRLVGPALALTIRSHCSVRLPMDPALGVLAQTMPPPVRLVISVSHSDVRPGVTMTSAS